MRHAIVYALLTGIAALAETPEGIALPKANTTGGKPLMQALAERRSTRNINAGKLPLPVLSNLLWAAFGVNRSDGRRTAPSASNRQIIDVYAVTADGAYIYNPKNHRLDPVVSGDIRATTGTQSFVAQAPLNLVYVADYSRMTNPSDSERLFISAADTGFIGQNVYLFCASEGLATVVRASLDRDALAKALKLRPDQKITLAQTVGYPKAE